MEADGVTRVYFFHSKQDGRPAKVRQWWPDWTMEYTEGEGAQQVIDRSEFYAVGCGYGKEEKFIVHPADQSLQFEVDVTEFEPENRPAELARAIEEHSGKSGLTIKVS